MQAACMARRVCVCLPQDCKAAPALSLHVCTPPAKSIVMLYCVRAHIYCCACKQIYYTVCVCVCVQGHLLESETYIGGKVAALEAGVFRSDLPLRFRCTASAYQGLIDRLDTDLTYAIKHEGKLQVCVCVCVCVCARARMLACNFLRLLSSTSVCYPLCARHIPRCPGVLGGPLACVEPG